MNSCTSNTFSGTQTLFEDLETVMQQLLAKVGLELVCGEVLLLPSAAAVTMIARNSLPTLSGSALVVDVAESTTMVSFAHTKATMMFPAAFGSDLASQVTGTGLDVLFSVIQDALILQGVSPISPLAMVLFSSEAQHLVVQEMNCHWTSQLIG